MNDCEWVTVASNHAVISRDELMEWLGGITSEQLRVLLVRDGLPPPRFGNFTGKTTPPGRLNKSCRWRVGDVRAWLAGAESRLTREVATDIGAEQSKSSKTWHDTYDTCGSFALRSRYRGGT